MKCLHDDYKIQIRALETWRQTDRQTEKRESNRESNREQ